MEAFVEARGQTIEATAAEMVTLRDAELSERVALDLMTETQKRLALRRYEARITAVMNGTWREGRFLQRPTRLLR